ncbi:MAG: dihydroorotate dehydrogenase electron transfer subunit [Treponema sp.]|jgi:NAD(P)H-flavin reductase|nr:dihydroorotate dehydrogenase electron transfer subunit [Treponema sp.]
MKARTERLLRKNWIGREIVQLDFSWAGPPPRGGQFFLLRPKRSGVFLGRPLSAALWNPAGPDTPENRKRFRGKSGEVCFLVALRGRGTKELADMAHWNQAELTGPLGNAWGDFLPPRGKAIALIGGGIGIAPLRVFAVELAEQSRPFDLYAGFKAASLGNRWFRQKPGQASPAELLVRGAGMDARNTIIATEDGGVGQKGRIPDFFDPAEYGAVCACGPEPMLKAVAEKCRWAAVPCFVSLERSMACGVGACLGCTVQTAHGNRRCCADGPVFPAEDVYFEH